MQKKLSRWSFSRGDKSNQQGKMQTLQNQLRKIENLLQEADIAAVT